MNYPPDDLTLEVWRWLAEDVYPKALGEDFDARAAAVWIDGSRGWVSLWQGQDGLGLPPRERMELLKHILFKRIYDTKFPPPGPKPPEGPVEPRSGHVTLTGRAFQDAHGPFLGFGFSYFHGASTWAVDPDGFRADMAVMQAAGANFARMICFLDGGRISPDPWTEAGNTSVERFIAAMEAAWAFGIRTEVTIFGGLAHWPSAGARLDAVEALCEALAPRLEMVQLVEITNEYWMNFLDAFGGTIEELRQLAGVVRRRLGLEVPVSLSSPQGTAGEGVISETAFFAEIRAMYDGSKANIWTPHWDRDSQKADGVWRTYRQPWESVVYEPNTGRPLTPMASVNNEPIGPLSSVAQDDDPGRLVNGFVISFISGQAGYVFHTDAGIWSDRLAEFYKARPGNQKGLHRRLLDHPTVAQTLVGLRGASAALPKDLPNWRRTRHLFPDHPFAPSFQLSGGLSTQIWPDRVTGYGVVRAYAALQGQAFVMSLLGVKDHFKAIPRAPMELTVYRTWDWGVVHQGTLGLGEALDIQEPEAVVMGRFI